MCRLFFFLLLPLIIPFSSFAALPCEEKIQVLEEQGVNREALLQAVADSASESKSEKTSRYVVLIKTGADKAGTLQFVDFKTGKVEEFSVSHGVPDEFPAVYRGNNPEPGGDILPTDREVTRFGSMSIDATQKGDQRHHRMDTSGIGASGNDMKLAQFRQHLLDCTSPFQRTSATMNDLCLDSKTYRSLQSRLQREQEATGVKATLFIYPGEKAKKYFEDVTQKELSFSREVPRATTLCQYAQNMNLNRSGKKTNRIGTASEVKAADATKGTANREGN